MKHSFPSRVIGIAEVLQKVTDKRVLLTSRLSYDKTNAAAAKTPTFGSA